jgi:hypothetical protein
MGFWLGLRYIIFAVNCTIISQVLSYYKVHRLPFQRYIIPNFVV